MMYRRQIPFKPFNSVNYDLPSIPIALPAFISIYFKQIDGFKIIAKQETILSHSSSDIKDGHRLNLFSKSDYCTKLTTITKRHIQVPNFRKQIPG